MRLGASKGLSCDKFARRLSCNSAVHGRIHPHGAFSTIQHSYKTQPSNVSIRFVWWMALRALILLFALGLESPVGQLVRRLVGQSAASLLKPP